jgi:tetratricopeptide (TPR) repeat protein
LQKLAKSLLNSTSIGTVINQAITGMGGLGKTQLAVEFAYRYGKYFQGVHWLNLADPTTLDSEIALCGSQMGLDNWPPDQPSQVTMTELEWKRNGPRLLILDNFEEVAQARAVLSKLHHLNLRLLVTSRRPDWTPTMGLASLPLDLFSPTESLAFLNQSLKKRKDKEEELITLAERLGNLPLGLELASRYLNDHPRLRIAEYLVQAKQAFEHPSMKDWRKEFQGPTAHDLDLQRTFALSWNALTTKDTKNTKKTKGGRVGRGSSRDRIETTAQILFLTAGYLAPNVPIPLEIFERALKISTEICDENLSRLYGLGLLHESETQFPNSESQIKLPSIHPLLAEYARGLAKENKEILEGLANVLGTLSKETIDSGLPTRFIPIHSHMPVAASYAEEVGLQNAGTLWNNYGSHLRMIADYSGARNAHEHSLIVEPENATFVNNLAVVYYEQGDLISARMMIERALKIDEETFGSDHPTVARDVNNWGEVMRMQGNFKDAQRMYKRAIKIWETNLGVEHPQVAIGIGNLGLVMHACGDLAGARSMFERALKIDESFFGPNHPNVAKCVNNLGLVLRASGDLTGARIMYERALEISEASLGLDHPNIAICVNNLGYVLQASGDLKGAHTMYERALAIFKKSLPPDHPNIKVVQWHLDSLNESL